MSGNEDIASHQNTTADPGNNYKLIFNMEEECFNYDHIIHSTYDGNVSETDFMPYCDKTFDGLLCWDSTPAGQLAYQSCSDLIVGWDTSRRAFKRCTENGTWERDPITKRFWTDYTNCIDYEDLQFRQFVNDIYVWGYTVSIICLVISLAVFIYYKHLQCSRTLVHMNLFASLVINNLAWIIWYKVVVADADVLLADGYHLSWDPFTEEYYATVLVENLTMCHVLHLLTQYFMVTSYFWAFCEGLHLHISISVVFITNEKLMMWFHSIGWGFPLIITLMYAALRYYHKNTSRCWIGNSEASWIIFTPVLISLIASLGFLGNAVRVLVIKLRAGSRMLATKKAVRAAFILIPLFGLHYMLIPLRPVRKAPGERAYQIISAVITSFQGIGVSFLFCFTNSEVITAIRNHVRRWRERKDLLAMTGITLDDNDQVDNIEDENAEAHV